MLSQLQILACGCLGESSHKMEIKKSDIIFSGKVLDKKDFFVVDSFTGIKINMVRYYAIVNRVFKGRLKQSQIEVVTGVGNGDCGFNFEVNKSYIIYIDCKDKFYAKGQKVTKFLYTDICKKTRVMNDIELLEIKNTRGLKRL
jgi:hypothetical protein